VTTAATTQSVYFFGDGRAEGTGDMKSVLGGKGAGLAEMTNLGVPVPPGFTIACAACVEYLRTQRAPEGLREEVEKLLSPETFNRAGAAPSAVEKWDKWAKRVKSKWPLCEANMKKGVQASCNF